MKSNITLNTILLLFLFFTSLFAGEFDTLKKIFPSVENLEGGSEKWLTTAFEIEKKKDYFLLKRIYSYFGDKETEILKIKRKKEFKVEVNLYFARDFLVAQKIFSKLSSRKADFKREIKLGDKGVIFGEKKKGGGFNADYTLLFKLNNFVVMIKGDDGFAVMDFTDFVKNEINKFIMENISHYLLSTIKLKIEKEGYEKKIREVDIADVLNKNIIISGNVYDYNDNPVEGAIVSIDNLGIVKKTDKKGYFEIKFNISNGDFNKKSIKIYLKKAESKKKIDSKLFYLKLKRNKIYNEIFVNALAKKVFIKKENAFEELITSDFKMKGNRCEFFVNCSRGAFFRCKQKMVFYTDGVNVFGKWVGTGGSGSIKGVKLVKSKNEKISLVKNCLIKTVNATLRGEILNNVESGTIFSKGKIISMAYIDCFDKNGSYFLLSSKILLKFDKNIEHFKVGVFRAKLFDSKYELIKEITDCKIYGNTLECDVDFPVVVLNFNEKPLQIDFTNSFLIKRYAIDDLSIQQGKMVAKFVNSNRDIVSMRNTIVRDGKKDLAIKINISGIKGVLDKIEVVSKGVSEVKWDTDDKTVFPAVAVFEGKKFLNDEKGRIKINLDGNNRSFVLYIADSSLVNKDRCEVILYVDGKIFKTGVKNGNG